MARDNGEAGAEGQRPDQAFPKPFIEVFAGFTGPYESGGRIKFSTGN
jgi:hypothetical protein